jgi:hypothetical protein
VPEVNEPLRSQNPQLLSGPMKFFLALLVWFGMAAILVKGVLMSVGGHSWLLVVGLIGFVLLVAKIACLAHD